MDSALIHDWSSWLEHTRRLRSATINAYRDTLLAFFAFLPSSISLDDVSASDIEEFMRRPRSRTRTPQAATQDKDRCAIQQFYRWAQSHGHCRLNPTVDVGVPKVRNRVPRAVDDAVWQTLWSSTMLDEDRVWLGMCAFAGLRRREITSLSPEQVDVERGLLLRLQRKGGAEDAVEYADMAKIISEGLPHVLPDVDRWLALVDDHRRSRDGERCFITMDMPTTEAQLRWASFDDPMLPSPSVINDRLSFLLKEAGLPRSTFTPHALRHTCVTNLLRCGVPIEVVSDAVGHSAIDTTRRYVKTAGRLQEWHARLRSK